ncbi:alcohol dehydrogenase catalytic domain-containing protein [Roseibium sp. HPY-6]|uniref:zinc-dependent alcohol dehydrogenase n=1 Tax=Roseibium sp. HPY-6 TaxID=3229852 RepID=UPI00338E6C17
MRSVRLHDPLDIRFEQVDPAPAPGKGEVRIKVAFAGICGSDIHNYKTGQWISRRPSVAGHEFSGTVDAVGEGIDRLSVGDKVVADSRHYCTNCVNCQTGNNHLCSQLGFVGESIDGGFADFTTLPERLVFACDPSMKLDIATLAEPLAVALHALDRVRIEMHDPLLVVGCGPIGALVAVVSDILHQRPLLICDRDRFRVETVAAASAGQAVDLAAFDQFQSLPGNTVRHVIDTTGNVEVIQKLEATLTGATLGLVGIGQGTFPFDPVGAVERELTLVGCHAFKDQLLRAVQLLEQHSDRFRPLIEHRISLEDTPAEYARISVGKASGIKTLIDLSSSAKSGAN